MQTEWKMEFKEKETEEEIERDKWEEQHRYIKDDTFYIIVLREFNQYVKHTDEFFQKNKYGIWIYLRSNDGEGNIEHLRTEDNKKEMIKSIPKDCEVLDLKYGIHIGFNKLEQAIEHVGKIKNFIEKRYIEKQIVE